MGYETKIRTDQFGYVTPESLTALTATEWKNWIDHTLHDQSKILINNRDSFSDTDVFDRHIPYLPKKQRLLAYTGISKCLDEAYESRKKKNDKTWDNSSLDNLLFLVAEIETKWEDEDYVKQDHYFKNDDILRFLNIITPKPSFTYNQQNPDVYVRILQSLSGFEAKLPYSFWQHELTHSPSMYASTCFYGAAQSSAYDGIRLLKEIDWSKEETQIQMESTLTDGLCCDYYDSKKVMAALEKTKKVLPNAAQETIDKAIQRGKESAQLEKQRKSKKKISIQ